MKDPHAAHPTKLRVLLVGPMAPAVGGMATLIEQSLTGPLARSVEFVRHPTNGGTIGSRSILRSAWRHLWRVASLARTVLAGRVDVVHIYTCSGFTFYRNAIDAFVARRCGVPVILHICGGRFGDFCAKAGFLGRRIIRRALTGTDRVVVLSPGWRELLAGFAPEARFQVIPCGIPLPPPAEMHGGARQAGACRFVFLGAVGRAKGVDTLLEAAARLRARGVPYRLTLAGPRDDTPDTWSFDRDVQRLRLGGHVEHVGYVSDQAKGDLLAGCDCFVLPSRAEGLPLVLLEAGARGLAVVASAVGAVPEVINDAGLGLVVPPDDPDRLAEAMAEVAEAPLARQAMGRALRQRVVTEHSLERQSHQIASLYRALTADRARPTVARPAVAEGATR